MAGFLQEKSTPLAWATGVSVSDVGKGAERERRGLISREREREGDFTSWGMESDLRSVAV